MKREHFKEEQIVRILKEATLAGDIRQTSGWDTGVLSAGTVEQHRSESAYEAKC